MSRQVNSKNPLTNPNKSVAPTWPECYPISDAESPETESPETESPETESPETESPETESPETESPETETCSKLESFPELVAKSTGKALAKLLFARYFCKSVDGDGDMVGAPPEDKVTIQKPPTAKGGKGKK